MAEAKHLSIGIEVVSGLLSIAFRSWARMDTDDLTHLLPEERALKYYG
jgi:hypothetical protein